MVSCSWINETLADPVSITLYVIGLSLAGISFYYLVITPIQQCESQRSRSIKSLSFLIIFTLLLLLLPKLREQWINMVKFCLKTRNYTSEVDVANVSLE